MKQASGRFSALCLPPEVSTHLIELAAARAVQRLVGKAAPLPYIVQTPVNFDVQVVSSDMADRAMLLPGVKRDGLRMRFAARDMREALASFRALVGLCYPR